MLRLAPITPLLYPFICESYGIRRQTEKQQTITGRSAPHTNTTPQYHYYNQYWNKSLKVKRLQSTAIILLVLSSPCEG